MADLSPNLSVITLNIDSLSSPIERQRLAKQIKKFNQTISCLQETHFEYNHRKVKEWKNMYNTLCLFKKQN